MKVATQEHRERKMLQTTTKTKKTVKTLLKSQQAEMNFLAKKKLMETMKAANKKGQVRKILQGKKKLRKTPNSAEVSLQARKTLQALMLPMK